MSPSPPSPSGLLPPAARGRGVRDHLPPAAAAGTITGREAALEIAQFEAKMSADMAADQVPGCCTSRLVEIGERMKWMHRSCSLFPQCLLTSPPVRCVMRARSHARSPHLSVCPLLANWTDGCASTRQHIVVVLTPISSVQAPVDLCARLSVSAAEGAAALQGARLFRSGGARGGRRIPVRALLAGSRVRGAGATLKNRQKNKVAH